MAAHWHIPVRVEAGQVLQPSPGQCRCAETVPQMVHLSLDGKLILDHSEIKPGQRQELRHVTFADPHCPYCDGTGTTVRTELTLEIVREKIGKRLDALAAEIKHTRVSEEAEAITLLLNSV